jgi:hypothetical protein
MHSSFYHYEEVRARLYDIIRVLQAENPDVTILIEQMAPAKSEIMTPELESYFSNLQSLVQPVQPLRLFPPLKLRVETTMAVSSAMPIHRKHREI